MPLLTPLERRSAPVRLLLAAVYAMLALGAATMLYPFLVMVGSSLTSAVDVEEYQVVPRYFRDDVALFRKHLDEKYASRIDTLNALYGADFLKFAEVTPPQPVPRG